jgi:hypothetical protein
MYMFIGLESNLDIGAFNMSNNGNGSSSSSSTRSHEGPGLGSGSSSKNKLNDKRTSGSDIFHREEDNIHDIINKKMIKNENKRKRDFDMDEGSQNDASRSVFICFYFLFYCRSLITV